MSVCACMGPQNGEPLCPCLMRAATLATALTHTKVGGLPELPEPVRMSSDQAYLGFTSEQMHTYARAALSAHPMSIDHGKLLALADEMSASLVDYSGGHANTLLCKFADRLRAIAIAQPAEAVECDDCDAGWQWFEGYGREHRVKCETCGGTGTSESCVVLDGEEEDNHHGN